jgi:RHS repeat-associated protein
MGYDSVKTTTIPKNYNGNITEQLFRVYGSTLYPGQQNVVYTYDPLNRLNSGISSTTLNENVTYDNLGNITALTRGGATGYYSYSDSYNANRLVAVSGLTNTNYTYDLNGNMNHDGKNNATLTYNLLNLPQTVTSTTPSTGINITYTYDANGQKLRKVSNGSSTDYISGIQYKPDAATIDFIQTEEGRAINSGGNYTYEYTLTDHLGNNRVTFDRTNGKVGEEDYYPFGLNMHVQINGTNKYLYNKKELQDELGQYDYGARFYDPVIARWNTVDPLAESYEDWSPFNYVQNNPIRMIDPDGMGHFDTNGNWVSDPSDNVTYDYLSQVTQRGQTFTWMGSDAGWIAEQQLSPDQLETMYWNYTDSGQNPFQGAYGNQIRSWSSSSAGFQSGYRRNAKQLTFAKYTLFGTSLILGPSAAASTTSVIARVAEDATPIELNGGIKITSKGLLHVMQRHTINIIAKFASKSKFNTTDAEEIENLIMQATQHPVTQQSGGNLERIVDAGRIVGVDRATGLPTSTYTVITKPSGELVTAFPGKP